MTLSYGLRQRALDTDVLDMQPNLPLWQRAVLGPAMTDLQWAGLFHGLAPECERGAGQTGFSLPAKHRVFAGLLEWLRAWSVVSYAEAVAAGLAGLAARLSGSEYHWTTLSACHRREYVPRHRHPG